MSLDTERHSTSAYMCPRSLSTHVATSRRTRSSQFARLCMQDVAAGGLEHRQDPSEGSFFHYRLPWCRNSGEAPASSPGESDCCAYPALERLSSFDEAVKLVASGPYGQAASVWSTNLAQTTQLIRQSCIRRDCLISTVSTCTSSRSRG